VTGFAAGGDWIAALAGRAEKLRNAMAVHAPDSVFDHIQTNLREQ
jgi:hypothetical protein